MDGHNAGENVRQGVSDNHIPGWRTNVSKSVDGRWKYDYAMPFEVIAWMPFPEPYEDGEEE